MDTSSFAKRFGELAEASTEAVITLKMPDFKGSPGNTLWREGGVRCVLVPAEAGTAVELRSEQGGVFLRKLAPSLTAAGNEAEYLRLLLQNEPADQPAAALKPFALIVEDEQDTADVYREALRFSGVRALTVPTGRDALRRAEELIPDLIILDYRLPDVHGRELCRQFRANPDTRRIPILVVTASPQDDADSEYPDAVLTKPCLLPTLLAASRLLLSRVLPTTVSRPPTAPTA